MNVIEIENELIENFKNEFYSKLGYYPVVLTESGEVCFKKVMSLEQLADLFEDVMPSLYGKKLGLRSKKSVRILVEIRCIFVYLARCLGYKLKAIAKFLNRHHSTIIYNEELFHNMLSTNLMFRKTFEHVFLHIRNNYNPNDELSTMVYFNKAWHQSQSIILSGLLPHEDKAH